MARALSSLVCLLLALGALSVAAPAAFADGSLTRVGNELRFDSDAQDAENLVITVQAAAFECAPGPAPCIQFANGPQEVRDNAAGCVQVTPVVAACTPVGDFTSIALKLDDGEDFAFIGDNLPPVTIDGGSENDNLSSSNGDDTINGGADDDEIFDDDPSAGDTLNGGDGNDQIFPSGGPDVVFGGAGTDTVSLESDDDTVRLDDLANDGRAGENKNIHSDVEVVDGGGGGDSLFGNAAGNTLIGGSGNDLLFGNGGNDVLDGEAGADDINGGSGEDRVRYADAAAQTVTLDGNRNDGAAGELDNVHPDVEDVAAGAGNDTVVGSSAANVLDGGDGNDVLDGRAAIDSFLGGNGADVLTARDGLLETVDCGAGTDTGTADTIDLLLGCEGVVRSSELEPDADRDGSVKPADCNDLNPAIHPGAKDIPRNGIDEDCSGKDAQFRVLRASISFKFSVFRTFTRLTRFKAVQLNGKERIRLRCSGGGCPFKAKKLKVRKAGSRNMTRLVRPARFRRGAVLKVLITKPQTIGRYRKFKFRAAKDPKLVKRCIQPGKRKPSRCPGS